MVYLLRAASEDNPRNNLAQISSFWELGREHLTYAMSINAYSRQKLEHLQLDHKEK